jgi:4-carboxymuconolactone decarboxylase
MKATITTITTLLLAVMHSTNAQTGERPPVRENRPAESAAVAATVAPALDHFAQSTLRDDLWKRPELSVRDRSIATLAILITRDQRAELASYFHVALDNGVKPKEISEIITHLAFYAGWGNAMAAVAVAKDVFEQRNIGMDQLPPATPKLLPLDRVAEERRAAGVQESTGRTSPGLAHFTGETLFKNLWLRPDLASRDRSLVTVCALIASGQTAQVTFHLNRALDNGLTEQQAGEVLAHAAFYAGWPNAFSAAPVFKAVFESRTSTK